ncbi:MAG: fibronectin type III domain-containing protein [Acidobacteriota bacterium]
MRRTMSRRNLDRQRPPGSLTRRRVQVVIAFGIVLSLFAAWTMLANSGAFDSALRQKEKKGQTVSTASLNSNSPSKEYTYAGGRLVATEEAASSGCVSPPSPGNLFATAQTATSVVLNWAPSSGAHHYEVQRRQSIAPGTDWVTLSPNPNNNTFTDGGVVANTAYLYRVRAVDAASACPSDYSNVDLATTVIFADDPLLSQVTTIKAQHVTQLRQAVDAVRVTANIGPAAWANPLDQVRAVHFSELRARLNEALPLLGFSQMPTDPAIAQGNTVGAVHLQPVRDKVK